jgi:pyridoxal phosphate enzyme (YggS family)
MTDLSVNVRAIRDRIATAAARVGRDPAGITLVAVSKTHPASTVRAAFDAGVVDFGENRVVEAAPKAADLADIRVRWHLIGHLQRNKARKAVEVFAIVHSLDSVRLAETLDRLVAETKPANTRLRVLLQINIAGETQKEGFDLAGGLASSELEGFYADVQQILAFPHLQVCGLMTVAPYTEHAEEVRPVFRALRELRDALQERFPDAQWTELSMGMTNDFEVAIEEGATLVRVGRAIFGNRPTAVDH